MGAVGQVNDYQDGRWYERPSSNPDVPGLRCESVTAILGSCTSKPWLVDWSAKLAAQWAVDHVEFIRDSLLTVGREPTVAMISKAASEVREAARGRGSNVHHVVEALHYDVAINNDGLSDDEVLERDEMLNGYLNFLTDFQPVLVHSEATVADPVLLAAGTLDLGMVVNGTLTLIDVKTGNEPDPVVRAQLGAYYHMTELWLPTGLVVSAPAFQAAAVLHLSPSLRRGYALHLLKQHELEGGYHWFLSMREQHRQAEGHKKLGGRILYPAQADGSQPMPYLEDIDGYGAACGALKRAGYEKLSDLQTVSPVALRKHDGVGPKTVQAVSDMFKEFGGGVLWP
jgi:hypothetical protein